MKYFPELICICGHAAKFHRKDSYDETSTPIKLLDCSKCHCDRYVKREI